MQWIASLGLSARSQSRILSGIKAFYKYLILEENLKKDPTDLLEAPKIGKKLPDTLSKTEIIELIESVDLSHPQESKKQSNARSFVRMWITCFRTNQLKTFRLAHKRRFRKNNWKRK